MSPLSRRSFVAAGALAAGAASHEKLALLGGKPVRTARFPSWPKSAELEEQELLAVLRSGRWNRGKNAERFEQAYAKLLGTKHCLATANGTSALFASLNALGVGPGDEVIVPPYTFVATINSVLLQHALPVFVDTDPATFQIDARKIEAAVNDATAVIMPVHMAGSPADLDTILATGKRRGIPVLEDACQAHLAEWRGQRVGSLGTLGCFSFQASKNLNSGEGGAVATNDTELYERAHAFHNAGQAPPNRTPGPISHGSNLRLTEFQAALLTAQMTRIGEQSKRRDENAAYLTKLFRDIPGIEPAQLYPGATRSAWHLYMFRYRKEHFAGVPKAKFLKALAAEGVPASSGYRPLNKEPYLDRVLKSKAYAKIYSADRLKRWFEQNHCPANDQLCEEAVWFTQTMLLAEKQDMEQIAEAIRKIQTQAATLL